MGGTADSGDVFGNGAPNAPQPSLESVEYEYKTLHNPYRVRLVAQVVIATVSAIGVFALPLALYMEFDFDSLRTFFAVHYPHLTVYPILLFWGSSLCLIAVWNAIPLDSGRLRMLKLSAIPVFAISAVVTWAEQAGDNMMVLEFSQKVQERYCMREIIAGLGEERLTISTESCPDLATLIEKSEVPAEATASPDDPIKIVTYTLSYADARAEKFFDELFSYKFWADKPGSYSRSRVAYIATVFCTTFIVLTTYFMVRFLFGRVKSSGLSAADRRFNRNCRHLLYILLIGISVSVVAFFLWIPFRVYYNFFVKLSLFDSSGVTTRFYFGPTEIFICVFACLFAVVAFVEIIGPDSQIIGLFVALGTLLGTLLGITIQDPLIVADLFGLSKANPLMMFLWPLLMILVVWYFMVSYPGRQRVQKRKPRSPRRPRNTV